MCKAIILLAFLAIVAVSVANATVGFSAGVYSRPGYGYGYGYGRYGGYLPYGYSGYQPYYQPYGYSSYPYYQPGYGGFGYRA